MDDMIYDSEPSDNNFRVPVIPLRDVVVYPHMVIPLFVGRKKSISALELAMQGDKQVFLAAQADAAKDEPEIEDINQVGCVSTILQLLKLPDGTVKVLVEGRLRAKALEYIEYEDYLCADLEMLDTDNELGLHEVEVLKRSLLSQFEQYVKLNKKIPPEILTSLMSIDDIARLSDTIIAHMPIKIESKQIILEIADVGDRVEKLMALIESEIELLQVEKSIRSRVKGQMEKSQREYYLNEQRKAIQDELGELEGAVNELDEFAKKIEESGLSKDAKTKATSELKKLKMMSPMSAEATVSRNYLDVLLNLPWKKKSKINNDLRHAQKILDEDHYGLEKVKERILEYLAVQTRVNKIRGPVLCLVGPPGVGKTSLGRSIARATGRKFARMSLGGVRDEAEVRGHRRTYIGALPGKIVQKLTKTNVKNPLFLLDEVDKMASDFRGDPAAALLEVLDPEQNSTFNDHYLEVDYDLSDVLFIATANTLNIPGPLLDRMETIRIPGYTELEKIKIAERHLIPKQLQEHGLTAEELNITESAVREIIHSYTREAGVRSLEREISKLCRKIVKEIVLNQKKSTKKNVKRKQYIINVRSLEKYLGVKRFRYGPVDSKDQVGQVKGLAWTEVGGELLTIEAVKMPGKGKTTYTGRLGDVMQESIHAAMSVVRSRAAVLGIVEDFHEKNDLHIHVPEGATPKDGPSAGISMCTAIVSILTDIPVRADVAMTGEITLRGEVLPIGGLKEKLLAALRAGIKTVIIPAENQRDLKEIPKIITKDLVIKPVQWIDEVLHIALQRAPEAVVDDIDEKVATTTETKKKRRSGKHARH